MDDSNSALQTAERVGFDTLTEKPLSAVDAAKLHRRLTGRKVSIRTLYRWMSRGRNGVVLQHVKMAGQKYTSAEAMDRFFNSSAAVSVQSPQASRPKKKQTKTAVSMRQRQIEAARQNLIARGIITGEAV